MYIQNNLALNCSEDLQCKIPIPKKSEREKKVQSTVTLLLFIGIICSYLSADAKMLFSMPDGRL